MALTDSMQAAGDVSWRAQSRDLFDQLLTRRAACRSDLLRAQRERRALKLATDAREKERERERKTCKHLVVS